MTPFYTDFDPVEYYTFAQTETFRRFGKHQDVIYHTTHDFSNFGRKKLELKWIMHPTLNSVGQKSPYCQLILDDSSTLHHAAHTTPRIKWSYLRVTILGTLQVWEDDQFVNRTNINRAGRTQYPKPEIPLQPNQVSIPRMPSDSPLPPSAPPSTELMWKHPHWSFKQATFSMQGMATLAFAEFFEWWTGRAPPDRLVRLFKPFWIRSLNCKGLFATHPGPCCIPPPISWTLLHPSEP